MRIAQDFDGCLAHTMGRWVQVANTRKNWHLTMADIDRWAFYEKWGMSVDEAFSIFDECWRNWERLKPMEHDLNIKTAEMMELGEVDIVTSIDAKHEESIFEWLKFHGIKYNNLVHRSNKHELPYDVYVDDSPINAQKLLDAGKIILLYDQPWNRGVGYSDGGGGQMKRIYNIRHAIDEIDYIKATGGIRS